MHSHGNTGARRQVRVRVRVQSNFDMASPIGAQGTFTVEADAEGSSIQISISEHAGIKAENLSLSTWGASFILANLLHKLNPWPSKDHIGSSTGNSTKPWILELGAGTGLVGLSAAALWGANVTLTDLPSVVPALADNIAQNGPLLKQRDGSASCGSLDWTDPSQLLLQQKDGQPAAFISAASAKPSVILAADVIYSEEHPEFLSQTITTWLARSPEAVAIMCYPLRMAYIDHIRAFWETMEASGLECVKEGREQSNEDWNEVAHTPYEWCVWKWRS